MAVALILLWMMVFLSLLFHGVCIYVCVYERTAQLRRGLGASSNTIDDVNPRHNWLNTDDGLYTGVSVSQLQMARPRLCACSATDSTTTFLRERVHCRGCFFMRGLMCHPLAPLRVCVCVCVCVCVMGC